ncbi:glycoside hydrolase family 43 protein [Actinoplanes derwentensis]|uniref:Xylan 1,4-beta-xylosidase n=1 Tax=Actinoplanes derwentensis TaxID=113562 RepID=A0A1H1X9Z3_9ACTN|nr:glycoside hydrolase family 43 protein [Actinoplanes derwentensis]GID89617.1 xylan 1,4-beta-xylosidase [Actinoplanes derwentensis]SDT06127.1 xylan 1,4-beta-xylosidase [Actinoplanes derwentensis]
MIIDPILPGFHPDPSAIRADGRYLVATSTFEWFPGINLHASADLRTWQPIGAALNRPEQLNLRGVPDSGGVWAPAISHHDGLYWLVFTVVRTMSGTYKDLDNYLVTAVDPAGPWSDPIPLNASGFDPSLFHAADGRRYLLNLNWDHRAGRFSFGGILLQEYDHDRRELVGEPELIFTSDELMEGSHLFERDGWFYLMLAEGGTGFHHGIRLARSRNLRGPYETDPRPLLTSRDDPRAAIHKAGHGQLITTADGEHHIVHLGARPEMGKTGLRSPLGRETFLQRVVWDDDGWLRLAGGGHRPHPGTPGVDTRPRPEPAFAGPEWISLRGPVAADLTSRPGWLRLRGQESLDSLFHQSLLTRRLTSLHCTAAVTVDADPRRFTETAGLVVYYNTTGYHYLAVTHDESRGRVAGLISKSPAGVIEHGWHPVEPGPLRLSAEVDRLRVVFRAGADLRWAADLDALSDEIGPPLRFTGTTVGVCVQDLARRRFEADFTEFALTDR